jgi:hypothetical protein
MEPLIDILIYLAIIAAPCAIAMLVYAVCCKAHHIRKINRMEHRIHDNRAEYRAGIRRAEKYELRT